MIPRYALIALRGGPMDGRVVEGFAGTFRLELRSTNIDPPKVHVYTVDIPGEQIMEAIYERTK